MAFGTDSLGDNVLGTTLGGAKTSIAVSYVLINNISNAVTNSIDVMFSMKDSVTKEYSFTNDIVGKVVTSTLISYDTVAKIRKQYEVSYNSQETLLSRKEVRYKIEAPIQILTKKLKVILPATNRKVTINQ